MIRLILKQFSLIAILFFTFGCNFPGADALAAKGGKKDIHSNAPPKTPPDTTPDTTVPTVTITAQPNSLYNNRNITIQFSATDNSTNALTYQCQIDSGTLAACTTNTSFTVPSTLAEGSHTIRVHVTDATGNIGTATSSAFTLDVTAPTISTLTGPANCTVGSCTNTLAFSTSDALSAPVTTTCSTNNSTATMCTSPYAISSTTLNTVGTHTISVTAHDRAGNTATRTHSFTIASVTTTTPPPSISNACKTPTQESTDTSGWNNIYIGTAAHNCNDTGATAGSAGSPYCNPHLAFNKVTEGTIVTFLRGEYRLANFVNTSGVTSGLKLPSTSSIENRYVIIRGETNHAPVILGSVQLGNNWVRCESSQCGSSLQNKPHIYRQAVGHLLNDPKALYAVIDTLDRTYDNAKRFRHVQKFVNGARSHADVSALDESGTSNVETSMTEDTVNRNFTWTKADANGAGCTGSNSDCFIYLRIDDNSSGITSRRFEVSQYNGINTPAGRANYLVLDNIHTRFTQCGGLNCSVQTENSDHILVQNSSFAHVANSNDNSYGLALWNTNGSVVRNNRIFDSAYWGGTPNSKGLTFMISGNEQPNWACNNEIYHIPGEAGIGSKGGVSNLNIVGNYIHDSHTCVQTDHERTQDGSTYPGGNWTILQNRIERCQNGITLTRMGGATAQPHDVVLNNLFLNNTFGITLTPSTTIGSRIHNNIFKGGVKTNSCNSYGHCGAGIYFMNNSGTVREFSYILGDLNIKMSHNIYFDMTYTHGINKNWTPNFSNYDLNSFRTTWSNYSPEQNSLFTDPALDEQYKPRSNSPAIGSGISEFFDLDVVNIGLYLN